VSYVENGVKIEYKYLVKNNFPKLNFMKSGLFSPLFEKDDCMDAGDRVTQGAVTDDCMDAGDRVTQGAVTEGRGRLILINPPRSPFFKGGGGFGESLNLWG
jgi:hypothetical protein